MNSETEMSCRKTCWMIGAGAGVLAFLVLLVLGAGFGLSLILGLIVGAGTGYALVATRCTGAARAKTTSQRQSGPAAGGHATSVDAAARRPEADREAPPSTAASAPLPTTPPAERRAGGPVPAGETGTTAPRGTMPPEPQNAAPRPPQAASATDEVAQAAGADADAEAGAHVAPTRDLPGREGPVDGPDPSPAGTAAAAPGG
ncbi:hypothetical protein ACXYMW_11215, partial [Roseivivax sp. CAU 1761]